MKKYYCQDCGESHNAIVAEIPEPISIPCPDCGATIFSRISFSFMWSDALGEEIKRRSLQQYPIEFHNGKEWPAIATAINQGIDSHLEAVEFTQSKGRNGRNKIEISPATLHVLVRRLMESGNEDAESLASGICDTLGIELI